MATVYHPRGTAPVPPALLAMVTLLQAYDQVGDAEAVVNAQLDPRWQMPLGCVGARKAPFSPGVLVKFRERMVAHDLDRKLVDRTVALAKQRGGFGWQKLRAALDSSPLLGAGRVEDTWNLIGRALRTVVTCAAKSLGVSRADVEQAAGLTLLGGPSLKAALDIEWSDPRAQAEAWTRLLGEVARLEQWVAAEAALLDAPAVRGALAALHQVLRQDLEPDPTTGALRIRRGVAVDRHPSLGDPEMRHGRKTRTRPFTGYQRHVITALDADVILDGVVRPANEPEHEMVAPLAAAAQAHGVLDELLMDRGYLASPTVGKLAAAGVTITAKPWPSRNGDRYPKHAFAIDLVRREVRCPAGETAALSPGAACVHFPTPTCQRCRQRPACTTARRRSVAIHPQEALLQTLRARQQTAEGRAQCRQRTAVEHALARVQQVHGPRARYKGVRKNTLDVRRIAAVTNLQRIARLPQAA